jgi:hypothetical protein
MTRLFTFFRSFIDGFKKWRQLAASKRRRMKELRKRDPFIY